MAERVTAEAARKSRRESVFILGTRKEKPAAWESLSDITRGIERMLDERPAECEHMTVCQTHGAFSMRRTVAILATAVLAPAAVTAAEPDTKIYEMRIYTAAPGKLDALHA